MNSKEQKGIILKRFMTGALVQLIFFIHLSAAGGELKTVLAALKKKDFLLAESIIKAGIEEKKTLTWEEKFNLLYVKYNLCKKSPSDKCYAELGGLFKIFLESNKDIYSKSSKSKQKINEIIEHLKNTRLDIYINITDLHFQNKENIDREVLENVMIQLLVSSIMLEMENQDLKYYEHRSIIKDKPVFYEIEAAYIERRLANKNYAECIKMTNDYANKNISMIRGVGLICEVQLHGPVKFEQLLRALDEAPEDTKKFLLEYVTNYYLKANKIEEAVQIVEKYENKIVSAKNKFRIYRILAHLHYEKKNYEKSYEFLLRSHKTNTFPFFAVQKLEDEINLSLLANKLKLKEDKDIYKELAGRRQNELKKIGYNNQNTLRAYEYMIEEDKNSEKAKNLKKIIQKSDIWLSKRFFL